MRFQSPCPVKILSGAQVTHQAWPTNMRQILSISKLSIFITQSIRSIPRIHRLHLHSNLTSPSIAPHVARAGIIPKPPCSTPFNFANRKLAGPKAQFHGPIIKVKQTRHRKSKKDILSCPTTPEERHPVCTDTVMHQKTYSTGTPRILCR